MIQGGHIKQDLWQAERIYYTRRYWKWRSNYTRY